MNITGKTIVYKNEFGYSTSISTKRQDGTYDKMYIRLQLPKNTDVENGTFIEIEKGFLSFYKDKNGLSKIKIIVMNFKEEKKEDDTFVSAELPF